MPSSLKARFYLLQIYNLLHESYTSNKIREILCKKYNVSLSTIYLWISEYNFQDINIKKFVEHYKKYKTEYNFGCYYQFVKKIMMKSKHII